MKNRFSKSTAKIMSVLFLFLGVAISANVNAQTQTILTVGNTFAPDTIICTVGDTVIFNLGPAATHNAVEVSQAIYTANGTTSNGGFNFPFGATDTVIPTLAQTYYYVCTPHVGLSPPMKGVIIANPNITLTASAASAVGVPDGQVTVSVIGGVGPYTYIWQNLSTGAGAAPFDTAGAVFSFTNVAGTYLVTTTDNGAGPFFSTDTITITAPGGSFTYDGLMELCGGPATTTDITAYLNGCSFLGPTIGTQYILTDSTSGIILLDTTLFVDSVVLPTLGIGTYYLSALNYDNGCTANDILSISTTTSLDSSIFSTNIFLPTLGSASITVSGGTAPYSLCWSDTSVMSPPACVPQLTWNSGDTLTNLAAGTYYYFVESADLLPCITQGFITIDTACLASLENNSLICDTEIYLDAEMNMVDTGAYTFNYQLTDGLNTIALQPATTDSIRFTIPVTSSGWYYLTATETTTGCIAADSIEVLINLITVTDTVIHCTVPAPCNGSINVTTTIPSPLGQFPYTFNWFDTTGIPIASSSTPVMTDLIGLCENTYCLVIEDGNGCFSDTLCYDVNFHPCDVNLAILDTILCNGGLGSIQATIDTSGLPVGPIPFTPGNRYTFQLFTTNPLTPFFIPVYTDSLFYNFTNLPSNNYLVTVFDSSYTHPCYSDSLFLFEPDPIVFYVAATDSLGALHSVDSSSAPGAQDGVITIDSITGGNSVYSITWLGSNGLALSTSGILVQDSLGYASDCNGGGYTIIVTDTNGCGPVTKEVYVHPRVDENILSLGDAVITNPTCFNSCDGTILWPIDSLGIYNVPPFTFVWTNTLTGFVDSTISVGPDHSAIRDSLCGGTPPVTYQLQVYDCYDNYFGDDHGFFDITDPDSLFVRLAEDFVIPCGEDSVLHSLVDGGNSLDDTLLIRTETLNFGPSGIGFSDSLNAGKDYLLVVSGTYANPIDTTDFDAAFNYDLLADTALNDTMHWQINGTDTIRPTPDLYQSSHIYNFLLPATGLLTDSVFYEFQILPSTFTGSLTFELYELTNDTSIYTYSWTTEPPAFPLLVISDSSTALTLSDPFANPTLIGDTIKYILTVLDAKGCEAIDSVKVSWDLYILKFDAVAGIVITDVICHGDSSGTISITVDSSFGFPSYYWTTPDPVPDSIANGATLLASIADTSLPVGDYVFHLRDTLGCLSVDTFVTITEPDSVYAWGIDTVLIHVLVDTWTMTFDAPYSYTTPTQDSLGYKLVVSGTYRDEFNNIPPVDTKDAAYQFNDIPGNPISPLAINEWWWNGDSTVRPMLDVYDPTTHTYTYYDTALTANYVFTYEDATGDYLDNGGSLFFELYKIVRSKTDTAYTCYGDATGTSAIFDIDGGIPDTILGVPHYDIIWTNDLNPTDTLGTNDTVVGLPTGNYTATITDSRGCSYERYLFVQQSTDSLQLDTLSYIDVACKGDTTGEIHALISGGFGSQYVVLLKETENFDTIYTVMGQLDTIHITALDTGTYRLYIYDTIPNAQYGIWTYDCERYTSITIIEPQDTLSSTISLLQNVSCFGDSTGKAISTVIGGQFPYTYAWDNGEITAQAISLWADSIVYPSPLWQGITFTDDNGCTLRDSIEIEHEHAEIQAYNTLDGTNTIQIIQNVQCFGICDGIATLSTIGGVLPHIYEWDILQTSPFMPDTAFNLCAGGHDVIVEDGEGCRQTILFMITEPDELLVQATMTNHVQCYGFNNGTALGSVLQGGTAPFTYAWDSISGQTGNIGNSLTPGIHTLWVTDSEGCVATDTVLITEPDSLQVEIIDSLTVYSYCAGTNSAQLCALATGGTPIYEYLWNDVLGQTTSCATSLIADQYTVTVRDERNCIAFLDFDLDSITNTMIPQNVYMEIVDASCFGGYNGSVTIVPDSVPSAYPPFSYSWNPALSTTNIISSLYAQSYAVVIEDSLGCEVTVNALVGEPDELTYTTYNVIGETCFGACDGQIWVDVQGGTAPYYYDNSQSNTSPPFATQVQLVNDSIITDLCADNSPYPNPYSIFITDDNNCTGALASGGTYIELVDSGVVVTKPLVSLPTIDASCYNSFDGEAWRIQSPGDDIFTYTWEESPLSIPPTIWDTGDSTSILYSGDYVLVAHYSDSANFTQIYTGCDAISDPFTISSNPPITLTYTVEDLLCYGDVNGIIDLDATGGTGTYTYLWDITTSIPIDSTQNEDQYELQPGTYTVTITDDNGCDTTAAIIVEEPDAIISDFTVTNVSCFGLLDGEIEITIVSGTSTYQYSLNGGAFQTSNIFTGLSAAIDTIIIKDDVDGCTDSIFPITVTEQDSIIAIAEVTSFFGSDVSEEVLYNVTCKGSSDGAATAFVANAGGTPPYTYSWDNGSADSTASNLAAGDYIVIVTDNEGCTDSDTVTIIEPDALVANGVQSTSSFGFDISCYGLNDGWIELSPSGGVTFIGDDYEYSWTATSSTYTATSSSIYNLIADTFSVIITDANGCQYDTSHVLKQPLDIFVVDIATLNYAGPVHGPASISFIDATTTLGNDSLTHNWYWGDFDDPEIFTNSAADTFVHNFTELGENNVYVLVTNEHSGCIADTVSFLIEVQGIPDPINNVFSPNNDGINDDFLFGEYGMENVEVYIYNRWGQEVYSWVGENKAWNGKGADGQYLPEGAYFFVFKAEGTDGYYYEKKGSVTLLR